MIPPTPPPATLPPVSTLADDRVAVRDAREMKSLHDGGTDGSGTVSPDIVDGPRHDGGDVGLAAHDSEETAKVADR